MTSRQQAAQATRRRILETAGKLVSEHGFSNVSIDDIVKASGVARGTFYIYFRNKADVIHEYTRVPFADLEEKVQAMDASVTERLAAYVREFTRCLEEYGLAITQQWVRDVADPRSSPESADSDKLRFDLAALTRLLHQGIADGKLQKSTPAEQIAELIACQLYGQMTCWCMSSGSLNMNRIIDSYCSVLLPALLKPWLKETKSATEMEKKDD
ncbi:MAG: TetR/AcrR family transcriptional regulator [Clostridia bacterium]|nr:TetR/AcrR family transcriptional regulator [Clostridia bacterium]